MYKPTGLFDICDELSLKPGLIEVWTFPLAEGSANLPRHALAELLSRYSGLEVNDIVFSLGPQGKPFLPGSGLEFNVSHTVGLAVMAFSCSSPVGIDVERADVACPLHPRLFSIAEREYLEAFPDRFARVWTAKEAVAKATGRGLFGQSNFDLAGLADGPLETEDGWNVHPLDLGAAFVGAVAWQGPCAVVQTRRLDSVFGA